MARPRIRTAEAVTAGHADKLCDQIADAILDAILVNDRFARVACEVLVTTGMVVVTGQITTKCWVDITGIVRETIRRVGYNDPVIGFDHNSCAVIVVLEEQSGDVSLGVDRKAEPVVGQVPWLDVAAASPPFQFDGRLEQRHRLDVPAGLTRQRDVRHASR